MNARRRSLVRGAQIASLLVLVMAGLASCASFQGEIPVATGLPERSYISPGVFDGIKDRLILPIAVTAPYEGMRIGGYRFEVLDASGEPVRTIQEIAVPLESTMVMYMKRPQAIVVPAYLFWEGRTDLTNLVPEGEYSCVLTIWDVYGNVGRSPRILVVVDNTAPSLKLTSARDTFSPNGDGNQDTLEISQKDSSVEDEWTGEIRSAAGATIRSFSWAGAAEDLTWDGKDDEGAMVPDGTYGYEVSASDRAGNAASLSLGEIHVDTRPGAATITVDPSSFSPNGDGVSDLTFFRPWAENPSTVERWELTVRDGEGTTRRRFAGSGGPPDRLAFNGRDDAGAALPDGTYVARLELWYRYGDNPASLSPGFHLDTVAPKASAAAGTGLFSPDGDGNADSLEIRQSSSEESLWVGTIRDAAGRTVRTRYWQGSAEDWSWDGRDSGGKIVSDGVYAYSIASTDEAGNSGGASIGAITADARPTPIAITSEFAAFSPTPRSRRAALNLIPTVTIREGVEKWSIQIRDERQGAARTYEGAGAVPAAVSFDGRDESGTVLPDGDAYRAVLSVSYQKGDQAVAVSPTFAIKTVAPVGRVSADSMVFSPDGDGRNDTVAFLQSGSSEDLWLGSIANQAGSPVLTQSWRGRPLVWVWDGRDADGRLVPDGTYSYTLRATDAADNSTAVELAGVRVDTRGSSVTLQASAAGVSPNGDGDADVVTLRTSARPSDGVEAWKLTVLDQQRRPVKVFSGSGTRGVPAELLWDGRTDAGRVTEGTFQAELVVEWERGSIARATLASPLIVDVTGPQVALRASPLPFSPDEDGANDTLLLAMSARGSTPIGSWSMLVIDPAGNSFTTFSGSGAPPESLPWDGRSSSGELVLSATDYTVVATATDALGNTGRARATVPVDILVIREGDRLRIVISSIYFQEFTADYRNVPAELARRNLDTLDRLAQKLARYPQYAIAVEGHAVHVYWDDPVLLAREEKETLLPLSLERASVVKLALADRGIAVDRMSTAGYGGSRPMVPHSDLVNRWKNRRVEFILVEK